MSDEFIVEAYKGSNQITAEYAIMVRHIVTYKFNFVISCTTLSLVLDP